MTVVKSRAPRDGGGAPTLGATAAIPICSCCEETLDSGDVKCSTCGDRFCKYCWMDHDC